MISIDAEIEIDSPVNPHMPDCCDACRLCIRARPSRAIPEERVWRRGVFKRKSNDTKCYPYFLKFEGCGICPKVCPIHRFGDEECMEAYEKDGTILGSGSSSSVEVKGAALPPIGCNIGSLRSRAAIGQKKPENRCALETWLDPWLQRATHGFTSQVAGFRVVLFSVRDYQE